jgi:hypothetical protein
MDSGEPEKTRHESPALERAAALKELKALIVRIQDGDEGAVPRLREILRAMPEWARKFVDPAVQTERSMIETYAGVDALVARETLPHTLEAFRAKLGGESPSPWSSCSWSGSRRRGCSCTISRHSTPRTWTN